MEKSALTNITEKLTQSEKIFVSDLKLLAGEARRQAYRSADHLLVVRNWLIGWHIVTQEQKGKERAQYGKHVIELASQTLTEEYGRGFGLTSIKNMRSFYLMFSKLQFGQAMLDQFKLTDNPMRVCHKSTVRQRLKRVRQLRKTVRQLHQRVRQRK